MPNATTRQRQRIAIAGGLATSLVFGMLIWAKLRLVTDIPRTAIAEPSAVQPDQAPERTQAAPTADAHTESSEAE
jgi:hypothetical protein